MIYFSSPGRTATTSISEWLKQNTSNFVLQEPALGKIIFILHNLQLRLGYLTFLEKNASVLLCMQLRYLLSRKKNLVYIDPFTSHSEIFRKEFYARISPVYVVQLTRERDSWAYSMCQFESYGLLKFIKPYIFFSSPISRFVTKSRYDLYLQEYDYRIAKQLNMSHDLILDYKDLIKDKGVEKLKQFFIKLGYVSEDTKEIKFKKVNQST